MKNEIVLKVPKRNRYTLTGVVRVTPDAEIVLQEISEKSGLPMRTVVSQMIIQGANFVRLEEE